MDRLSGWQIVTLLGMLLATIVGLVAMGQELGAIISVSVLIASALGVNIATNVAQNSLNSEKLGQVKDLANGNNQALREEIAAIRAQHADERAELLRQVQESNNRAVQLAAMIMPDKAQDVNHGQ